MIREGGMETHECRKEENFMPRHWFGESETEETSEEEDEDDWNKVGRVERRKEKMRRRRIRRQERKGWCCEEGKEHGGVRSDY